MVQANKSLQASTKCISMIIQGQIPLLDWNTYWFEEYIYTLYALQQSLRLIIGVVILILFACFFGYTQPYKNKAVNFQELLLLADLAILHAVSYHSNRSIFSVITNLMIF